MRYYNHTIDDLISKISEYTLLVVDGHRYSGKTTFIKNVSSRYDFTYYQPFGMDGRKKILTYDEVKGEARVPEFLSLPSFTLAIVDHYIRTGHKLLMDRGVISNMFYQRDECTPDWLDFYTKLCKGELASDHVYGSVLHILIECDHETLYHRIRERFPDKSETEVQSILEEVRIERISMKKSADQLRSRGLDVVSLCTSTIPTI